MMIILKTMQANGKYLKKLFYSLCLGLLVYLIGFLISFKILYTFSISYQDLNFITGGVILIATIIFWKLVQLRWQFFILVSITSLIGGLYIFAFYGAYGNLSLTEDCNKAIIRKYGSYPTEMSKYGFYKGHLLLRQCEHRYFPMPGYPNPSIGDINDF